MKTSSLEIYLHGKQAGLLVRHAPDFWTAAAVAGAFPEPTACWSLRLLTSTLSENVNVRTWFRALLPDSATCHRLALQRGLTPGNEFSLLASLGADCPGALSLQTREATSPNADGASQDHTLNELLIANTKAPPPAMLLRSLWPDDGGLLPVFQEGSRLKLPVHGEPSNALLRTERFGLRDAVMNEAFCMALATRLEVPVVRAELGDPHGSFLVCQRPDVNSAAPRGRWHMESFGQLLGLPTEQGFEREGGMALLDGVGLIRRYSCVPALDLRSLLRWAAFCHLIGNGLGCGRDFKFLFTPKGPRLAPFVGILSTHVYEGMSDQLGFYVGREDRPDWLLSARWRELAEELGIGQRYLLALLRQIAEAMAPAVASLSESWQANGRWSPVLEQVVALAGKRARQLWVALEAERV